MICSDSDEDMSPDDPTAPIEGSDGSGFQLRQHVIGLVDILGQRQKLRDLEIWDTGPESIGRATLILKETAGVVLAFREQYEVFRSEASEPGELFKRMSPELQRRFLTLTEGEMFTHFFSDLFVYGVELDNRNCHSNSTNAVWKLLFWLSGNILTSLTIEHPLRGAIDFGAGIILPTGEPYGSALVRPYTLEQHEASYPRIVLGQQFIDYLHGMKSLEGNSHGAEVTRRAADAALEITCIDSDGRPILDYMGQAYRSQLIGDRLARLGAEAFEFAKRSEKRYRDDPKLHSKYSRLLEYMEPRMKWWR